MRSGVQTTSAIKVCVFNHNNNLHLRPFSSRFRIFSGWPGARRGKIGTNGLTSLAHNIGYNGPIWVILVPLKSPKQELSNGTKMFTIGRMYPMLWANKVNPFVPIFTVLHLAKRRKSEIATYCEQFALVPWPTGCVVFYVIPHCWTTRCRVESWHQPKLYQVGIKVV